MDELRGLQDTLSRPWTYTEVWELDLLDGGFDYLFRAYVLVARCC